MLYDPEYVDTFKNMVLDDHDEKENRRAITPGTAVDAQLQLSLSEAIRRVCDQVTS